MTGPARPRHFEPYSLPIDPTTGLLRLAPNTERYCLPGGGCIAVELAEDDQITITDLEGQQLFECD